MSGPSVETIQAVEALAPASWGPRALGVPHTRKGWIAGAEFVDEQCPAHLAAVVRQTVSELSERQATGWALVPGSSAHYLALVVWGD